MICYFPAEQNHREALVYQKDIWTKFAYQSKMKGNIGTQYLEFIKMTIVGNVANIFFEHGTVALSYASQAYFKRTWDHQSRIYGDGK